MTNNIGSKEFKFHYYHNILFSRSQISLEDDAFGEIDINEQEKITQMTFLHYACQYGIEKIVTDLILKGANINLKDSHGNTALHFAAACTDNIQIIEAIINVIPKDERNLCFIEYICAKNYSGFNALRLAVEHKRLNVTEYLLKLYETYSLVIDNLSLLQLSSQKNDFSVFSMIEKSTCSTTYDKKGAVLIVAAENEDTLLTEKLLLETDFSIEATDERGYTPLLIAASCDNVENVRVLLEHDASITAIAFNGKTILAVAVEHNSTKVFKYLMTAETMIFTLSETIAHFCQTKLLYQRNFHDRNTPLHTVAQTGNIQIFNAMIEFYHDVNIRNFDLQTPLHIAAENGHEEIFEKLLQISTFSLHLPDKNGETPLSIACKNNSSKMIKFVMKDIDLISDPDRRKYYLQLSIDTKNTYLLKSLFNKHHLSQDIHHTNIHKDNQAYFKLFIENGYVEGVSFLLNSKNWKALLRRQPLSDRNPNPKSPMQLLVEFMPELAEKVFDKCIQGENYIYEFIDDIYYVDFLSLQLLARNQKDAALERQLLNQDKEYKTHEFKEAVIKTIRHKEIIDSHPLTLMVKHKQYDLLSHKLVESYIDLKWNRFAKWGYYSLCLFHFMIVLFLTDLIIDTKPHLIFDKGNITLTNDWEITSNDGWIVTVIGTIHLSVTIYKLYHDFDIKHRCFDLFFGILMVIFGQSFFSYEIFGTNLQRNEMIILNFCAWFSILNYLKRHPRFGVYVLMINHIVMSFLRFAPIFVMFLLPFAILFHVLLGEKRNIASFLGTFVQILVMMIGELDYKSLGATNTTFVTTTMFCLFLFIVTIFLMNLLIGLAVSDISKILEKAATTRRIMQIETIHHVELAMPEFLRKKFWKGFCQNEKAFKDFEKEKHYFTNSKFRQWFKWVGLPKSAIGTMNDDSINQLENKVTRLEQELKAGLEEQKKNITQIHESLKIITDLIKNLNKE